MALEMLEEEMATPVEKKRILTVWEIAEMSETIKLSSIVGVGKVMANKLIKCIKKGVVSMDLEIDVSEPSLRIDERKIDVEGEMKKSEKCEYWPNKKEFLRNFDLTAMDDESAEKACELLLKFKHMFFNQKKSKNNS